MPPVVEGRRRHHRETAPDADPGAERRAEAPETDRCVARRMVVAERRAQRHVAGRQSGDQSAGLDQQVSPRPERVAADGHVPRDVPVHAHHHA